TRPPSVPNSPTKRCAQSEGNRDARHDAANAAQRSELASDRAAVRRRWHYRELSVLRERLARRRTARERISMAGGQERILRRRIRTVQSTKKITRAMELIAASRIVKAQARVAPAVPYPERISDCARHLQESGGSNHPLLLPRPEIRAVALV